ncbi:HAMP domain-containing protein [Paludibacter sp. 221]|uniref:sensor histidine kinase n=1 Tax=Paludibacter sp. 221 TaxID=2302939 RepID=UPI0013D56C47|nr:ATP-binding protein [Paludibacter sp. 221]NDV45775.1 HAMP domain-containing protein [Paludibacter sp. 221]
MRLTKSLRISVIILFLFIVLGFVFSILYNTSPGRAVNIHHFQSQLNKKEALAFNTLNKLYAGYMASGTDSLTNYTFPDEDISYYILENDELVFWSDNQLDISNITPHEFTDWHYIQLPNAYCVILSRSFDELDFVALITIKYNYPYENESLQNKFARGFEIDKHVEIQLGDESDEYAVFCGKGHYLFSLSNPEIPVFNHFWALLSAIAFAIAFIFFFVLYARFPLLVGKRSIGVKTFALLFLSVGGFISLLLFFDIPEIFFRNIIFSPFHYAAHPMLSSICHLSVFTAFVFSSVCLFFFYVKTGSRSFYKNIFLLLLYPFYFICLYAIVNSMVFHSCIQLNILHITDFSLAGVWAHLLFFVWGIGLGLLFFKTHNYFAIHKKLKWAIAADVVAIILFVIASLFIPRLKITLFVVPYTLIISSFYIAYFIKRIKYNYVYLLLWGLFYAGFIGLNLLELNIQKNRGKYRVLAQNVYENGNVENDRIADILLEELDSRLVNDAKIGEMMMYPDSTDVLKDYLDKTYFRGFWNKYDIQVNYASYYSELYSEYLSYIVQVEGKIGNTHFYSVPTTQNAMTYIGIFPVQEGEEEVVYYFLEFYPRRQYKSYSFPDLLIPASADIHKQLNVSVAKYDNRLLTYSSGIVEYPSDASWIPAFESDYKTLLYKDRWHYIYKPNTDTYIVVSKQNRNEFSAYLQFFIYLTLIYFTLIWFIIRLYQFLYKKEDFHLGLASRFQYTFITLLIISFAGIFYVSIDFIRKRYEHQQVEILESKRQYIQNTLQDMYYWNQGLNVHNTSSLNFDLQDLSYIYQTDIHVFDNDGVLVGSSQPLIFYRHLISNRMSPKPFFSSNSSIEQYEHIGESNYLAAYTDFYNGDYLQIGYIAIPQFFSEKDLRTEIENFSSVIIHIYFFIILVAIFLTIVVGKRLSAPLNMLEKKLKEMRIGQRNEKIDYKQNDEIGQLVAQYNRTVDELEQSAKLLAKSERESAWKLMARQVAHEINNPLTPMKLSIQQLRRRKNMDDDGFDEYFENSTSMLIEQIDNLSRIAGTFSDFARMPEAQLSRVDVSLTLQSVVRLFADNNEKIDIQYSGAERDVFVYADQEQLIQVFNNLMKNAIQSIPKGRKGLIKVNLNQSEGNVVIRISDNGSGIPKDVCDKMFTPNFTTKAQGMGLGLAISKNIVEQVGGTITFETEENKGSIFVVILPSQI